uniref:Cell division protein n=1 Tax=Rhexinema sarcinoideum TaxID=43261 RepID=A0A1B2RYK7_9CHLO|nr:cell division protein [Rhexinema sarcinoideum]
MQTFYFTNIFSNQKKISRNLKKKNRFKNFNCQSFGKQIIVSSNFSNLNITCFNCLTNSISLKKRSFYNLHLNSNIFLNFRFKKNKFYLKPQALNDIFETSEVNQTKKKTESSLYFWRKGKSWKKSAAIFYYLLDAYKKTLRVKFDFYFQSSTNFQFLLAASPFIAYFIQLSLQQYNLKYQQNTFFQKSLPGVSTSFSQITWETFTYSNYASKINKDYILQINSLDDGFFIYLNSNWHFQQKQLSAATFLTSKSSLKWCFLPSRYFYQFLTEKEKKNFQQIFLKKNNFLTSNVRKSKFFENNSALQVFFNEFDDIPKKLNSVFLEPSHLITLQNKIQKSFLNESVNSLISEKHLILKPSFSTWSDFNNQFSRVFLNYQKSTLKCQSDFKNKLLLENQPPQKSSSKLLENKKNWTTKLKNEEKKNRLIGSFRSKFFFLKLQKSSVEVNPFANSNSSRKLILVGVYNKKKITNQRFLINSNLKKQNFLTNPDTSHLSNFNFESTHTRANFLNDIFTKEIQKNDFYYQRNFQYTTQLGFSQFGKIIRKAIYVSQKPGAPKIWQKVISKDLRKAFPNWINDFLNQKKNLKILRLKQGCDKTLNFSLLKVSSFETLLAKSFLTNKTVSPLLTQNSDVCFQFLKNISIGKSKSLPFKFNGTSGIDNSIFFNKNSNSFYFQRKVSGYLYPDSFQSSLLKNPNLFKINLKQFFKFQKKNSLAESYYQGFSEIISPSLAAQKNLSFSFFLLKSTPKQSLIQVYQPLIQTKGIASSFKFVFQNRSSEDSSLTKKLKIQTLLNRLQPDKALTTRKLYFFGVPQQSPVYGLTFEKYKEKYVKDSKPKYVKKNFKKYEFINYKKKTKNPSKSSLIFPYQNSQNFLLKANQKLVKKKFLSKSILKPDSFNLNLLEKSHSKAFQLKFTNEVVFNELSKDLTFSNSYLEKKNFFKVCSIILQKSQKEFEKKPFAIPYKTHIHYTKSKILTFNKNDFLNSSEKTVLKSKTPVSNSIGESFSKFLKKPFFATDLYEPINSKSWSILSQLGFIFILFKLSKITQKEYTEEILFYVDEFYAFLNDYEKSLLDIFIPEDKIRIIQKQNIKFKNVVGGEFFLTEFGEVIVLLRNSRKKFFKWQVEKPKSIKLSQFYLSIFSNLQNYQTFNLTSQKLAAIFNLNDLFGKGQKNFDFLTEKKTNLKFENFIPKGILLVGPPGTGKTLFVKAFAGETEVPIIVESGKTLSTNKETSGAEKLKELFQAAQKMSPCILFFDEIDTIGQKRNNVISTSMVPEIQSQTPNTLKEIYFKFNFSQQGLATLFFDSYKESNWDILNPVLSTQANQDFTQTQTQKDLKIQLTNEKRLAGEKQNRDLAMLTQLLYELDGLTQKQEIIVIGATNRPATLDSALTRPGRFGKIIYLDLPGKQKRFELLKFYSQSKSKSFLLIEKQTPKFCWLSIFDFLSLQLSVFSNFKNLRFFQLLPSKLHLKQKKTRLGKTKFKKLKTLFFLPQLSKISPRTFHGEKTKKQAFNLKSARQFIFPPSNIAIWKNKFQNIEVDTSFDWNYFANQTVGLSSAHLSAAMNRSAFKAIFNYLLKEKKNTNFSNFFLKRFEVKNKLNQTLSIKFFSSIEQDFYTKVFFGKNNTLEKSKNWKLKLFLDSTGSNAQLLKPFFLTYNLDLNEVFFNLKLSLKQKSTLLKFMPFSHFLLEAKTKKKNQKSKNQKQFLSSTAEKKFHKPLNKKLNNQPHHTFESVEYGIQTIMTTTSRPQLKFKKANQIEKNLMGQFVFDDFIEKKFQNFAPTKQSIKKKFNFFLKGQKFFEKHRFYLRTLAFLKGFVSNFFYQKSKKKNFLKQTVLISLTFLKLKILKRYFIRIIQNYSFGWIILFNSTCLFQNSLFHFSFQKQNSKSLSNIYYSLLVFDNLNFKEGFQTLLKWQNFNEKRQKLLFGDSFFLNRSAYYLSGKAIIHFSNSQEKQIDPSIHLWSFMGQNQTRQKKSSIENAFLTKNQFENFIFSLIAGKAAETLILANQKVLCQKENVSNIGFEEIKKAGFLIQLMHNKYLFYSQKLLTRKQANINLVENKKQINEEEFLFLKELSPLFEIQKRTLASSSLSHLFQKENQFRDLEQPWWQFEGLNLLAFSNLKYAQWYRLLIAEEQQNFRNIEWIASDNYFHIQPNNFSLVSLTSPISQTKTLRLKQGCQQTIFDEKNLTFKYFQFSKLNWNQLQLYDFNLKVSYFLLESFNKVFILLENNRELVDFLAYFLICNEKLRPFEVANIHKRFFK